MSKEPKAGCAGLAGLLEQLRPDMEIVIEVTPDRMRRIGDDVEELLTIMREHGFHTYRLPTDYRARSYPPALRHLRPSTRWRGRIDGETELVFSRVDAESLP